MEQVLIHSAPPWATSGYGKQCAFAAHALKELGYEVAISAYAGCHEEREWQGIPILGTGGKPFGNGIVAGNYKRWRADLLILFTDLFVMEPQQFAGLTVMPWVPIDTEKLGAMDQQWLTIVNQSADLYPVAMSQHGQQLLAQAGFEAPIVPHATDFRPNRKAGQEWRRMHKVPPEVFLITKVGVNNEDDRKGFGVTLQAFERFARKHPDAGLFLHTEAQLPSKSGLNLAYMAVELGLRGRVAFADEYLRGCDLYDDAWMEGLYNASNVLDASSKGEGFGVPIIEALACGTPVIGCRNSAVTEKINSSNGWLVSGQREWARHHNAWWTTPSVEVLAWAYGQAHSKAASLNVETGTWTVDGMKAGWEKALADAISH